MFYSNLEHFAEPTHKSNENFKGNTMSTPQSQRFYRENKHRPSVFFYSALISILILLSSSVSAEISSGTLAIDKAVFDIRERVVIEYGDRATDRKDWIGIYKAGTLGPSCQEQNNYVAWKYAKPNGANVGFSQLPAGDYVAQLFSKDGYCHVGLPVEFTVREGTGLLKTQRSEQVHPTRGLKIIDDHPLPKRQRNKTTSPLQRAVGEQSVRLAAPLDQTFKLHSRPSATKVIYLDFDGHNGIENNYAGLDLDGSPTSFSSSEMTLIQQVWQSVSEDFMPFDVDVTTEFPGLESLRKVGSSDTRWGIRVVISDSHYDYSWAYIDSFNASEDLEAFAYTGDDTWVWIADSISHEVGHSLGLQHDGTTRGVEYYAGHKAGTTYWAPIMGWTAPTGFSQWDRGEYPNANNKQDDLQIITTRNGFGYRPDDHGSTLATARQITLGSQAVQGLIERNNDVDMFLFSSNGGQLRARIKLDSLSPNLYPRLRLLDVNGTELASTLPNAALSVEINQALPQGSYYLSVVGAGNGNPTNATGFSAYGSVGYYSLEANVEGSGSGGGTGGGSGGGTGGGSGGGTGGGSGGGTGGGSGGGTPLAGVSLTKSVFNTGEPVTINFAGATVGGNDWIGIYPVGKLGASCKRSKKYAAFQYVTTADGQASFSGLTAGSYVAQMFDNNGYCFIGSTASFSINAGGGSGGGGSGGGGTPTGGVTLSKAQFSVGEIVAVDYTGATVGGRDWVGIYPAGSMAQSCVQNSNYTTYQYVNSTQGRVNFTGLAAGSYVTQLFDNDGYCFIGSSANFTVSAGGNGGGGNGGGTGGGTGNTVVTVNPYAGVNWSTYKQYKANFHTHTNRSDGNDSPATVIDQYYAAGYKILSITDHDTITWPWTNYGRNPSNLNMLAVKGDEYSRSHHVNVFYQFSTAANTLQDGIPHVQSSGGLCHINHPKRYSTAADWGWYLPWFRDYPSCVGIEVVNRDTVFPELWDNINENLFSQHGRLTWGFANDDTHGVSDQFHSFQMMVMPGLTEAALIESKKKGAFYFCNEPGASGEARVSRISSISVDNSSRKITLFGENYNSISWVGPRSQVIGNGNTFDFTNAPAKSFVRAVLKGSSGACYTQPFGLGSR